MSEPITRCRACSRIRHCLLHRQAEHPPTAARQWLERSCAHDEDFCDIVYQAGVEPGLALEGQGQRPCEEG